MPPMDSRKVMTMPPIIMMEKRSTALELHHTQPVSSREKSRLASVRGASMPKVEASDWATTEPPPLT